MKMTSPRQRSFSPVVERLTVEETYPHLGDAAWSEDEAGTGGAEMRLPAGVVSLQHWLDLNA